MADDSLAQRIERLEDREAIRALCSRYSLAVDDHDFDTLGGLFAVDARYGWVDAPPQAEGRAAITELLRSRIGPAGPSFHVNHDMVVDWGANDRSRATGIVFCHAEVIPSGKHLVGAIRYRDSYVKQDGRWLFAARFLSFLYFTPIDEYPGILGARERLRMINPPAPAHWPVWQA
jgi:hypothetical protein